MRFQTCLHQRRPQLSCRFDDDRENKRTSRSRSYAPGTFIYRSNLDVEECKSLALVFNHIIFFVEEVTLKY